MARFSGFLSERDPDELEQMDSANENNRQARFRIRQRAARALRDFVILESNLPDTSSERGKIFQTAIESELWGEDQQSYASQWMRDIFSFLIRGYVEHSGDKAPVGNLGSWIEQGLRSVNPNSYVGVDIRVETPEEIDILERRYQENPEELANEDIEILYETGRIEIDELFEMVDDSYKPNTLPFALRDSE